MRGRAFTPQDTAASTPVMVINETMARRLFGTGDPLGRRMRSWRDENVLREIVGVVSDVRYTGLADECRCGSDSLRRMYTMRFSSPCMGADNA